jgi:CRP-like cAMP-binding protein
VILRGAAGVWIVLDDDYGSGEFKELKKLGAYDSFGEMALMSESNVRTATIITSEHTCVAILHKDDFLKTIGKKGSERIDIY